MSTTGIKQTDTIDGFMSLGELWTALSDLTTRINMDNNLYNDNEYPVQIRSIQLTSIKALVRAIEAHHS